MIVETIERGNITITMSVVQAQALALYLKEPRSDRAMAKISADFQGIAYCPVHNVTAHLEAIRVGLDGAELDMFPHLLEDFCDCEDCNPMDIPPGPVAPPLVH